MWKGLVRESKTVKREVNYIWPWLISESRVETLILIYLGHATFGFFWYLEQGLISEPEPPEQPRKIYCAFLTCMDGCCFPLKKAIHGAFGKSGNGYPLIEIKKKYIGEMAEQPWSGNLWCHAYILDRARRPFALPLSRWELAKSGYNAKFDTLRISRPRSCESANLVLHPSCTPTEACWCPKSLLNKVGFWWVNGDESEDSDERGYLTKSFLKWTVQKNRSGNNTNGNISCIRKFGLEDCCSTREALHTAVSADEELMKKKKNTRSYHAHLREHLL